MQEQIGMEELLTVLMQLKKLGQQLTIRVARLLGAVGFLVQMEHLAVEDFNLKRI